MLARERQRLFPGPLWSTAGGRVAGGSARPQGVRVRPAERIGRDGDGRIEELLQRPAAFLQLACGLLAPQGGQIGMRDAVTADLDAGGVQRAQLLDCEDPRPRRVGMGAVQPAAHHEYGRGSF